MKPNSFIGFLLAVSFGFLLCFVCFRKQVTPTVPVYIPGKTDTVFSVRDSFVYIRDTLFIPDTVFVDSAQNFHASANFALSDSLVFGRVHFRAAFRERSLFPADEFPEYSPASPSRFAFSFTDVHVRLRERTRFITRVDTFYYPPTRPRNSFFSRLRFGVGFAAGYDPFLKQPAVVFGLGVFFDLSNNNN